MIHHYTEEQITRFIKAWEADFNEVITREFARSELDRLLDFFGDMAREFHRQKPPLKPVEKEQEERRPPMQDTLF